MSETNQPSAKQHELETDKPDSQMTTIEHAQLLLEQDEQITQKVHEGSALENVIDPSNEQFGPTAHPEQVQMRVAKRALMQANGIDP